MPILKESKQLADWTFAQSWYPNMYQGKMAEFFGSGDIPAEKYQNDPERIVEAEIRYNQWLIFDCKISGGKETPLDRFIREHEEKLANGALDVFRGFKDNFIGFFEVADVKIGRSVTLRNLRDGKEYFCREFRGTFDIKTGDIMLTRITPYRGHWVIQGGGGIWHSNEALSMRISFSSVARKLPAGSLPAPLIEQHVFQDRGRLKTNWELVDRLDDLLKQARCRIPAKEIIERFERGDAEMDVIDDCLRACEDTSSRKTIDEIISILDRLGDTLATEETRKQTGRYRSPLETALVHECGDYVMARVDPDDYVDADDAREDLDRLTRRFLDNPHPALDSRTPRQAILDERKARGDNDTDIPIKLEFHHAGATPEEEMADLHNRGIKAQKDGDVIKALKLYGKVLTLARVHGADGEFFRTLHNVSVCYACLGNVEKAREFLRASLRINPDYAMAKQGLEAIERQGAKQTALRFLAESFSPQHMKKIEQERPSPDKIAKQSTKELLAKISKIICEPMTEASFRTAAAPYICAEDFEKKEWYPKSTAVKFEDDFLWMAAIELWKRLLPERPCVEQVREEVDDIIDEVHKLEQKEKWKDAARRKRELWSSLRPHLVNAQGNFRQQFWQRFCEGAYYDYPATLNDFLYDFSTAVANAHEERYCIASDLWEWTKGKDFRLHQAQALFELKRRDEAEAIFRELVANNPDDPWMPISYGDAWAWADAESDEERISFQGKAREQYQRAFDLLQAVRAKHAGTDFWKQHGNTMDVVLERLRQTAKQLNDEPRLEDITRRQKNLDQYRHVWDPEWEHDEEEDETDDGESASEQNEMLNALEKMAERDMSFMAPQLEVPPELNQWMAESDSEPTPALPKVGRNDPCPCGAAKPDGSPRKYKHCCGR